MNVARWRRGPAVWGAAAVALAAASPARGEPVVLGTTAAPTRIAALDGWAIWSRPDGHRFRLVAWHDGVTRDLATTTALVPDLDLGTTAGGRVVATFSRCAKQPPVPLGQVPPPPRDCAPREVDLQTGGERLVGVPRARGASDTNPSMWRGRLAFARSHPHGSGAGVAQILLWDPRRHTLKRLRHGAVPSGCGDFAPSGCRAIETYGIVRGLDLGDRLAAFLWEAQSPATYGRPELEVRADDLRSGTSSLLAGSLSGEACTGGSDDAAPMLPTVSGGAVLFAEIIGDCWPFSGRLTRVGLDPRRTTAGPLPAPALQVVQDGASLYALVPAPNTAGHPSDLTCSGPVAPCDIERIDPPAMSPR